MQRAATDPPEHDSDAAGGASQPNARRGVLLTLAYDGRHYSGLARQDNARTIAGELEGALRAIDPRVSHVRAASRTDRGVHARGQLVAFDTGKDITPRGWLLALTQHLPTEVAVLRAERVAADFDPRRHAIRKTYRYTVLHSPVRDPFLEGRAWRIRDRFNHSALHATAQVLVGRHDFAAFRSADDKRMQTVRQVFRIDVGALASDPRISLIEVEGDGFMHKMVRIIVGALVDIGRGRLAANALERALSTRVRSALGITAPADGLCLERVVLDQAGWDAWPDSIDGTAPVA